MALASRVTRCCVSMKSRRSNGFMRTILLFFVSSIRSVVILREKLHRGWVGILVSDAVAREKAGEKGEGWRNVEAALTSLVGFGQRDGLKRR